MAKIWFITGSSRGLGRHLTEAVLATGDKVAAAARDPKQFAQLEAQYPGQLLPVQLDVTDGSQIHAAIDQAVKAFGRIDVLVNNAGFGITGAAEAYTDEQVRSQLETNLYAPIAITRAVLPIMRRQYSGHILQVSSIGGRVGNPGLSMYQAAKFGLSGFSEALAKEVAPLGIRVTAVEPGGFRTDWGGASMTFAPDIEGYETSVGAVRAFLRSGKYVPMGDPEKAAKAMISIVHDPHPPVHLVLGSEAVALLQAADASRQSELLQYLPLSTSTDHDNAVNFLETVEGRAFVRQITR
jgi:NAD(P)-dependent dehydrogenase (short-subunit alcohol dehydrogenase family)